MAQTSGANALFFVNAAYKGSPLSSASKEPLQTSRSVIVADDEISPAEAVDVADRSALKNAFRCGRIIAVEGIVIVQKRNADTDRTSSLREREAMNPVKAVKGSWPTIKIFKCSMHPFGWDADVTRVCFSGHGNQTEKRRHRSGDRA